MTRPSPARPDGVRRARPVEPIPSTVWLCPPDPDTASGESSAADVVAQAVTSFSTTGERVGLLSWPTPAATTDTRTTRLVPASTVAAMPIAGRSSTATIAALGRLPVPLHLATQAAPETGTPSPLSDRRDRTLSSPHPTVGEAAAMRCVDVDLEPVDLIITEVEPGAVDETTAGRVTLAAAGSLRRGGILVVLTHCDHRDGVLVDTGAVLVTAGQNADLLYLQHIVAVHAPVLTDGDHLHTVSPPGDRPAGGLLMAHRRVHSDVYVLAHQQDHYTDVRVTVAGPIAGDDR